VTYSYHDLLSEPLPKGVNPDALQDYLDDTSFLAVFRARRDQFGALPKEEQEKLKKEAFLARNQIR
jgi:hypothetical protein